MRQALLFASWTARLLPLAARRAWWGWAIADAAWLAPTLIRNHGTWGPIIRGFNSSGRREVWLTIDDGPDPATTPSIIKLLHRFDARATFFMIGEKVNSHRVLTRAVIRSGHTIGNHTRRHLAAAWWGLPPWMVADEIRCGSDSIHAATGKRPEFFRSPVGMTNPWVHPALERQRNRLVGWSATGCDGIGRSGAAVVNPILRDLKPGGIILVHESGPNPMERLATLELLLENLAEQQWKCVIPEL